MAVAEDLHNNTQAAATKLPITTVDLTPPSFERVTVEFMPPSTVFVEVRFVNSAKLLLVPCPVLLLLCCVLMRDLCKQLSELQRHTPWVGSQKGFPACGVPVVLCQPQPTGHHAAQSPAHMQVVMTKARAVHFVALSWLWNPLHPVNCLCLAHILCKRMT